MELQVNVDLVTQKVKVQLLGEEGADAHSHMLYALAGEMATGLLMDPICPEWIRGGDMSPRILERGKVDDLQTLLFKQLRKFGERIGMAWLGVLPPEEEVKKCQG